jgi:thioredoxin 1
MSIPTLIVFKDGEAVEQLVGVQTKEKLNETIEKYK